MTNMLRNTTAVVAMVATLGGCSSLNQTQRGAVIGAGAGGAVGAAVGAATGSTARGAIIGAAVGGVAGAVIGAQMDKQREELASELEGARVERYGEGDDALEVLNYERIDVCRPGRAHGRRSGVALARMLERPLTRRYGADWYARFLQAWRDRRAALGVRDALDDTPDPAIPLEVIDVPA